MNKESLDQAVQQAWKAAYALSANDAAAEAIQAAFKEYEVAVAARACAPLMEALEKADAKCRSDSKDSLWQFRCDVIDALAAYREAQQ